MKEAHPEKDNDISKEVDWDSTGPKEQADNSKDAKLSKIFKSNLLGAITLGKQTTACKNMYHYYTFFCKILEKYWCNNGITFLVTVTITSQVTRGDPRYL